MRSNSRRRRGSVYLIVLGAAMIVAVLGMSNLLLLRVQRRNVESTIDTATARHYAQTAIEIGLDRIEADDDWRTTYSSGVWINSQPIGDGTFTLEGIDPDDNNLADDDTDLLVLTGIGICGNARQKIQTTLIPEILGVNSLRSSLHTGGLTTFSLATVGSDKAISSNNAVVAVTSTINADVEAVLTVTGTTFNGTTTAGIDPREMPASTALDFYKASGTWIDISQIPLQGITRKIGEVVISPASNPFSGTTNASGIYVIDCGGQQLLIENTRVVGTLVVLNPGVGSSVGSSVNWQPAVPNYPSLLVAGDFFLNFVSTPLDETAGGSLNFNPAGTPYEGASDADSDDQYPSIMKGLVYISGAATIGGQPTIEGVLLVGSTLTCGGELSLAYDAQFYNDPPPGFTAPALMKISTGSWQRSVD